MVENSKPHAISQMAYRGANGNLCCLGDGIQDEGVKLRVLFCDYVDVQHISRTSSESHNILPVVNAERALSQSMSSTIGLYGTE